MKYLRVVAQPSLISRSTAAQLHERGELHKPGHGTCAWPSVHSGCPEPCRSSPQSHTWSPPVKCVKGRMHGRRTQGCNKQEA